MDRDRISRRIAALQAECAALGRDLAEHGHGLEPGEAFEVAGEAQQLANAADGLVAVAGAFGARVETTLTSTGPVERTHPVGFMDAMAAAEMSLATGLTEGVAGRKAALGAALGQRFPGLRDLVLAGQVAAANAHKVLDACAGLDAEACARVDARLAARLPGMDPARVTSEARRVAARVAADQVEAHTAKTKRGRTVEVRAGEDGLTEWWALLPTATSAAAISAVDTLAADYRAVDPNLTVPESRADAFGDLLLRNVHVTAQVTLGIPVITGTGARQITGSGAGTTADTSSGPVPHPTRTTGTPVIAAGPRPGQGSRLSEWIGGSGNNGAAPGTNADATVSAGPGQSPETTPNADPNPHTGVSPRPVTTADTASGGSLWEERGDDETIVDFDTGEEIRLSDLAPTSREEFRWREVPAPDPVDGGGEGVPAGVFGIPMAPVTSGVAVSGTQLGRLGWVDATTLAGLLKTVPMHVARAVLDADTGTQLDHHTDAYRIPAKTRNFVTARDATCRMWGCTRPAERCDLDHVRPWPTGATTPGNLVPLCRRHHRMKQRLRWRPTLHESGTLTWTDPTGRTRVTEPLHRLPA